MGYDMGNAGDMIKHGALAITIRWLCNYGELTNPLRFADPFGGHPWEEVKKPILKARLENLDKTKIGCNIGNFVSKCLWDGSLYYNSSHIAKRAVLETNLEFQSDVKLQVWASDKRADFRKCLRASGLCILEDKCERYKNDDGYSILGYPRQCFDFILLDPFSDFMPRAKGYLDRIAKIVEENPKIVIMVFVLDKYTEAYRHETETRNKDRIKEKHDAYCQAKKGFKGFSFSLRCPAIKKAALKEDQVKGESEYDSEILIISKQLENNPNACKLRCDLVRYAEVLKEVLLLGDKKIKFWPE